MFKPSLPALSGQLAIFITAFLIIPSISRAESCLKVMTYNIRFNNPKDGSYAWDFRKHHVVDLIRKHDPDIIGLQEVFADQLSYLAEHFPDYDYLAAGRDDGLLAGEMVPIFYKRESFAKDAGGSFWLSPTPSRPDPIGGPFPWSTSMNRIATWVSLRELESDTPIQVMNTHLDHQSAESRGKSINLLHKFMTPFAQDATLLVGDFNMTTKAGEFQGLFGKSPFQDAFLLSKSAPYINAQKTTLTAWTKLVGSGSHIDHIFVRNLDDVSEYQVLDDQYPVAKTMIYPSDHLPVLSQICLPGLL